MKASVGEEGRGRGEREEGEERGKGGRERGEKEVVDGVLDGRL